MFAAAAERRAEGPDLKALHAKIGQQALEIDSLAVALARIGRYERKTMIDPKHEQGVQSRSAAMLEGTR